ncbi:polyprenol phosphomannose-dependent alpha 1,6 mannosyltransferase MptB [Streptomyces sp. RB6PN25]|uniref:Polyprenol phosphomannose-dependent alpha 1,6 mannosyltransferase MptB n=1 Tax=Streptomyces humicola TaxID=2953240 RepID=A0ABT1PSR4_9ACTN|nr:polyprenol phosphomannose-dependent alpha 1,6 mannosyltransferase MptB [Streptomyces humicola]MCQ4080719.1 polyprenol phosphomannose-dependent alpha 1,6 mannosyltransferase MptB [Streptomyces humicola]
MSWCRLLGAAGAVALTTGALGAGALPAHDPSGLWLWRGPQFAQLGLALAYGGLVLLVGAWWRLGSLIARGTRVEGRDVLVTLAWWTVPLCVGPPLYSSDVYSYVAQGAMALRGLDVYRYGPAALGGVLAHNVAHVWRWTPSPYGPVFMSVAKLVARGAGTNVIAGVLGMRAAALAGIGLIAWAVRRLAGFTGVAEAGALWLGVLNPLVLIHLVAGVHNDALMIGLMMAGFVLTRRDRPVLGTVFVALAMLVKWPAGVGLLFLPALWRTVPGRAGRCLWVAAVAAATVIVTTALARTGYGWLVTQHAPIAIRTPMSITTDFAQPFVVLAKVSGMAGPDETLTVVQELGMGGALAVVAVWAWRVLRSAGSGTPSGGGGRMARGPVPRLAGRFGERFVRRVPKHAPECAADGAPRRPAHHPEYALGLSLLALVALAPVVQPWYMLWGLIPIAATGWDRTTGDVLKVASAGLAFLVLPSGNGLDPEIVQYALAGIALVAAALRLRRTTAQLRS